MLKNLEGEQLIAIYFCSSYATVLDTCALVDDLKLVSNADETYVGDKGINVSTQKHFNSKITFAEI